MATIRICDVKDCDRKHKARGFCQMHYNATPLARAAHAKGNAKYYATDAGRASHAKYNATDAGRAVHAKAIAKYRATDAGRAAHAKGDAKYDATDAGADRTWWHDGIRRARAANAVIGLMPRNARTIIYEAFGTTCLAPDCDDVAEIDHVIALANDGIHCLTNLQPLCGPCNNAKGKADTDYRPDAGRIIIAAMLALAQGLPETPQTRGDDSLPGSTLQLADGAAGYAPGHAEEMASA